MIKALTLWRLIAAMTAAAALIGCASSDQTIPLQTHQSVTDSLQSEIGSVQSHNGTLIARLAKLEEERRQQMTTVAELESTVTFLKRQIAKVPPAVTNPAPSYQHALEMFRSKNYPESAAAFQSLLDGGGESKLQDNCLYWIGECSFGLREYGKAIGYFQQVLAFEKSEKKDESQLMIARSCAAMGNPAQAEIEYRKLIDTYPASPYLQRAKEQMAKLK